MREKSEGVPLYIDEEIPESSSVKKTPEKEPPHVIERPLGESPHRRDDDEDITVVETVI